MSLSAQQLLDCIMYVGACEGGDILKTYSYLMLVRGMESDADYPYIAKVLVSHLTFFFIIWLKLKGCNS